MGRATDVLNTIEENSNFDIHESSKAEVNKFLDQARNWIQKAENVLFQDSVNSGDLVKKLRAASRDIGIVQKKVK